MLNSVEIAGFEAQRAPHHIENGDGHLRAFLRGHGGQHGVGREERYLATELGQASVLDGQQVELVEVRVVEAPSAAQVSQQAVTQDEAQRALGLLAGQAHELGGLQVLGERTGVGAVEAECLEHGIGQMLLVEHATLLLQCGHECRAEGEQEDEVVEVPSLQGSVLPVVGEAQQLARVWLVRGRLTQLEQLAHGAEGQHRRRR